MTSVFSEKIGSVIELCKIYKVKNMHIFGSATLGNFSAASDIDLIVEFDEITIEEYTDNYFDLHYKLEELFGRKIDLLTAKSLSNPFFIEKIEQTKQLIYAAIN